MDNKQNLSLVYLPPKDLNPYKNNPYVHPPEQVDAIAASIKTVTFINPIILDKNNEIIAGHGRLLAAKKLKLDLVPCLYAENLTPAQIKAYRILDNEIPKYAQTDESLMAIELKALQDEGFNMDEFGFAEMEKELAGMEEELENKPNPGKGKEPEKPAKNQKTLDMPDIPGLQELSQMWIDNTTIASRKPYKFISLKRMKQPDFNRLKEIKSECNPELIKYVAGQCADLLQQTFLSLNQFTICPAPQGTKAKNNKIHFATEFAKELGKILNRPVLEIFKPGYKPAFGQNNKALSGEIVPSRIIFFDDVLTTGTTLISCMELMKESFVIPLIYIDNR